MHSEEFIAHMDTSEFINAEATVQYLMYVWHIHLTYAMQCSTETDARNAFGVMHFRIWLMWISHNLISQLLQLLAESSAVISIAFSNRE